MSIRIGIMGYGNLGRGVECAIKHNPDMELVAVLHAAIRRHLRFLQRLPAFTVRRMRKK